MRDVAALADALLGRDLAAGLALVDLLRDLGDAPRAAMLSAALGELAVKVGLLWDGVADDEDDEEVLADLAWQPAPSTASAWDEFADGVRALFWVELSGAGVAVLSRSRLQHLLDRAARLCDAEVPARRFDGEG